MSENKQSCLLKDLDLGLEYDHVAQLVSNLPEAIEHYQQVLGFKLEVTETLSSQNVDLAFLTLGSFCLELICPLPGELALNKFLAKRGPGLHHLCYRTPDIQLALDKLKQAGFKLIDHQARAGARGHQVAFIHPSSCQGVLVELCQHSGG